MSDPVISVSNLSKVYRLGAIGAHTLKDDLARAWAKLRRRPDPLQKVGDQHHERREGDVFWALRDVSFEVTRGEVLGIIGANGAGKSTLLKILSRITAPTTGEFRVKGRIGSLLEVGTGFHPELSGRENIYLNGAILGMTKPEITRKLDEIVAFSGIEEFIDTPVKRYSSGMYVRLAFAVAAHLEPEILILDEVLAVGDATFQRKCLGKMGDVAQHGRTVLFVSHNMMAVQSLCSRAILLANGEIACSGSVKQVVPEYLKTAKTVVASERSWPDLASAPGNDLVKVTGIRVTPGTATPDGLIQMETPVAIEVDYRRTKAKQHFHLTFHLINEQEVIVLTTWTSPCPESCGHYRSRCVIPGDLLNSGGYRLKLLLVEDGSRIVWTDEAIASFTVEDLRRRAMGTMGREPSAVQVPLTWQTEAIVDGELPFAKPAALCESPGR
ncbi:MAG TPA: polysaccharide ABC transporter ATP-binding protein [Verrucomicrobiota bacterium]|nr:polysaccharide ABC transporter ATP-binding protein [Verrucomicrobiota bacterium]HQL78593.1 polysaccharide ABC transporter ATP-binding protein [Verrucomicrobiota bacterium]